MPNMTSICVFINKTIFVFSSTSKRPWLKTNNENCTIPDCNGDGHQHGIDGSGTVWQWGFGDARCASISVFETATGARKSWGNQFCVEGPKQEPEKKTGTLKKNQGTHKGVNVFMKRMSWEHVHKYSDTFPIKNLGKSWNICLSMQNRKLASFRPTTCQL